MKLLSRDEILGANDLKKELVACPEWGGDVYVRGLTAKERDEYEAGTISFHGKTTEVNMRQARTRLVVLAICDEQGNRMFTDADINALSKKSAVPIDRIYTIASRLSGITEEDIEEMTKNSASGQPEDSSSD